MKWLCLILMFCFADKELLLYRELLVQAERNEAAAELLYQRTEGFNTTNRPVLQGYRAMALFMLCRHMASPIKKLNYFNQGKQVLEAAIARDTGNVELRFLRYSVQSKAPAFLGYSANKNPDRQKLETFLQKNNSSDADLSRRISNFMQQQ